MLDKLFQLACLERPVIGAVAVANVLTEHHRRF